LTTADLAYEHYGVMEKDKLIASLLQPTGSGMRGGGPLIQPLGEEAEAASLAAPPAPPASDGPSLLEQMMALQSEARKEQELEKDKEVKKTTATFGKGFKKGFFGGGGVAGSAAPSSSSSSSSSAAKQPPAPAPAAAKASQQSDIPTIRPAAKPAGGSSKGNSLVIEEVQSALKEEDHALLRDLKAGQWVTPDLTQLMMGNEVLARGLRNPRCTAAIELMQRDPKEAQRRFKGDPEVDLFLREFGKVMSAHFESLSQKQQGEQQQQQAPEVGPLHAEVLRRAEAEGGGAKKKVVETSTEEETRVKEVLNDPELREFLMDPELQRILQECGDPIKFQRHMQNPATAYKIKRLFDSGLVGTAKDV